MSLDMHVLRFKDFLQFLFLFEFNFNFSLLITAQWVANPLYIQENVGSNPDKIFVFTPVCIYV